MGAHAIRAPRQLRGAILATAGFGNLNSLPLLVVAAVCQQESMPFSASLGAQCSSVGWGYVALGSAAMQIVMCECCAHSTAEPTAMLLQPVTFCPKLRQLEPAAHLTLQSLWQTGCSPAPPSMPSLQRQLIPMRLKPASKTAWPTPSVGRATGSQQASSP